MGWMYVLPQHHGWTGLSVWGTLSCVTEAGALELKRVLGEPEAPACHRQDSLPPAFKFAQSEIGDLILFACLFVF